MKFNYKTLYCFKKQKLSITQYAEYDLIAKNSFRGCKIINVKILGTFVGVLFPLISQSIGQTIIESAILKSFKYLTLNRKYGFVLKSITC